MRVSKREILELLFRQLNNFFTISADEKSEIENVIDSTLERCKINFQSSDNKYFAGCGGEFDPLHTVMNMIFLYYLSHELYLRSASSDICGKVYYLNKIMNSVDLFYAIELPAKFGAEHPMSSVMGRAKYNDGFFFYQNCTVGGTKDKNGAVFYPTLEENVHMYAGSSILGKCHIGKNVNIGAGAIIKDQDVPDNCTVFGESPNLIIKRNKKQ